MQFCMDSFVLLLQGLAADKACALSALGIPDTCAAGQKQPADPAKQPAAIPIEAFLR